MPSTNVFTKFIFNPLVQRTENTGTFWSQHPAFFYGLCAILGISFVLFPLHWPIFLTFFAFLVITVQNLFKIFLGVSITLCFVFFTSHHFLIPKNITRPVQGTAVVKITSIKEVKSAFGDNYIYRGVLKSFTSDKDNKIIAKNIPIILSEPSVEELKDVEATVQVIGGLKASSKGQFSLVAKKDWKSIETIWTLAGWRFCTKKAFQEILKEHIKTSHTASFLAGIAIGDFDDINLSMELGRMGLQHLMAISGIHFSILAGILSFLFRIFLGKKKSAIAVIILLTSYFIFLGFSPSVLRAWIAIVLMLSTFFFQRQNRALNALGIGLLAIALVDPLSIQTIPFQFSFGVTASILLWFGPFDSYLKKFFETRSLSKITCMSIPDRYAYCVLFFARQGLALTIAVNCVAVPITLFYFQKFPLMGLLYNLFFPFFVSLSMLLLLIAMPLLYIFPPLGKLLLYLNEQYTNAILNFVFNLPKVFDKILFVDNLQAIETVIIVMTILALGIIARSNVQEEY